MWKNNYFYSSPVSSSPSGIRMPPAAGRTRCGGRRCQPPPRGRSPGGRRGDACRRPFHRPAAAVAFDAVERRRPILRRRRLCPCLLVLFRQGLFLRDFYHRLCPTELHCKKQIASCLKYHPNFLSSHHFPQHFSHFPAVLAGLAADAAASGSRILVPISSRARILIAASRAGGRAALGEN